MLLLQVLALTAAVGVHTPAVAVVPVLDQMPVSAFVVDCAVSGQSLTDCKVVDGDPATNPRAASALKLAAQIQVPESMASANPGRIKIRLNVNP